MLISEIFHSIQGEGLLAGVPSVFLRTAGCNLRCWYCDTDYTSWDPEGEDMTVEAVLDRVLAFPAPHVVVTGGEPLIARDIGPLCEALQQAKRHVTVETAATVFLPIACDLASLSPKLASSTPHHREGGRHAERHDRLRLRPDVIQAFLDRYPYQLKFVIDRPEDLDEVEDLLGALSGVDRDRVLLMPQGRSSEELRNRAVWIVEACKARGFRYCPRLHIDVYGHRRGV